MSGTEEVPIDKIDFDLIISLVDGDLAFFDELKQLFFEVKKEKMGQLLFYKK